MNARSGLWQPFIDWHIMSLQSGHVSASPSTMVSDPNFLPTLVRRDIEHEMPCGTDPWYAPHGSRDIPMWMEEHKPLHYCTQAVLLTFKARSLRHAVCKCVHPVAHL